jgi:hypothetical protein
MKTLLLALLTGLLFLSAATTTLAGRHYDRRGSSHHDHFFDHDNDVSFDLDDGTLIITYERGRRSRSEVEFTEEYELFIDGDEVELNESQRKLVREFYDQSMDIVDYAKEIGWEGAKIGVEGAKLGARAIGCLFKLLSPGYDSDDMEDEMERAAERIEERAEILEEKAEFIEDMVEDLDDIADEMCDEIPELDDLGWF